MARKANPALEVRFAGGGITPESIPLNTMSRALNAVQRLALGESALSEDDDAQSTALRLVGVKRGSAVFPCVSETPTRSITNLKLLGHVVDRPETADRIASYGFGPLRDLSSVSRQLGCEITIRLPGRDGAVLAIIRPDTYDTIARSLLVEGDTMITGCVERAGGTTAEKCALRLETQPKLLYCSIESEDKDLVRKLGHHLYEDVAVSGTATWIRSNWRIVDFKIKELHERRKKITIDDLAKRVKRVGGRGWGAIDDIGEYLTEVTGEG